MKIKKLTPLNTAPVKREQAATVAVDANAIAPQFGLGQFLGMSLPFSGDDAE